VYYFIDTVEVTAEMWTS